MVGLVDVFCGVIRGGRQEGLGWVDTNIKIFRYQSRQYPFKHFVTLSVDSDLSSSIKGERNAPFLLKSCFAQPVVRLDIFMIRTNFAVEPVRRLDIIII